MNCFDLMSRSFGLRYGAKAAAEVNPVRIWICTLFQELLDGIKPFVLDGEYYRRYLAERGGVSKSIVRAG